MPHCEVTRRGTGAPFIIDANGYMRFRINDKGVYAHRYIMELMLGRKLKTSEHVHHKDGDRLNNFPYNLELMSASEHGREHMEPGSDKVRRLAKAGARGRWR